MVGMPTLKRSESYLGIHFDFHANWDCKEVGKYVTEEMVQAIIDKVRPDYIQCDCKGHRGISSYPTMAGFPAPGIERDQLRIWRDVTARNDVALYMHFSGVWDGEVVRRFPESAVVGPDGKQSEKNTSFYGPYVDQFLIPQLKELRQEYGVDGVWVDGECWSVEPDYGEAAASAFRERTGRQLLPTGPEQPGYFDLLELTRDNFRRYLSHYVDELHAFDPDFQIASNWAYSSQMPEPVSIGIDYISGDYSLNNSLNAARFEARCMMHQGKPWDLMAWSFCRDRLDSSEGNHTKTATQLKQEAAGTIMLGGGFQAYWKQKRDGSINPWTMDVMGEVATFCRERQEVCHRAEPIPQVAMLYAGESFYRAHNRAFGNWGVPSIRPLGGALQLLLDRQHSVEVCMSHHIRGRMSDYPVIVVPEWTWLEESLRDELAQYARGGGRLLLIGTGTARLFAAELDVEFLGGTGVEEPRFLLHNGHMAPVTGRHEEIRIGSAVSQIGELYPWNDPERGPSKPAAITTPLGDGSITAILFPVGAAYRASQTLTVREFVSDIVRSLHAEPRVEVAGSSYVEVALMRKGDATIVNLLNTAGPHADPTVRVFDEIPRVGPLTVRLRCKRQPDSVTVEPGSTIPEWSYAGGIVEIGIDMLEIHLAAVVR